MATTLRYAVVSPIRDEAENLPRLARCLAEQTRAPSEWIIVDTGSTDETPTIVLSLEAELAFVRGVSFPEVQARTERGAPIVRGFEYGLGLLSSAPDVVVKLDADVSVDTDHFDRLLTAFERDPTLGIASGTAEEQENGVWRRRHNTGSSVWGAVRAYRSDCLESVRPLELRMGWDGIDELKAHESGWTTRTIGELTFRHHRLEGERDGRRWTAWSARGQASHYMGYRPSYIVFRAAHHARHEPAAVALVWGYTRAMLSRQPVYPDEKIRSRLRQSQSLRNIRTRRREATGAAK
jgi:glycosyltransferase involved in cell wall biosynthesis